MGTEFVALLRDPKAKQYTIPYERDCKFFFIERFEY